MLAAVSGEHWLVALTTAPMCNELRTRRYCRADAAHPPCHALPPLLQFQQKAHHQRFAIVNLSGSQYKVAADDKMCRKIDMPIGTQFAAKRVLLVGEAGQLLSQPSDQGCCCARDGGRAGSWKRSSSSKEGEEGLSALEGLSFTFTVVRINSIELPPDIEAQLDG